MAIASYASVLVSTILTWLLALEHLAVGRNTVALSLRDFAVDLLRLSLGWSPGKVISADLDVVIGKLAELVIIHTEKLGLFGCTEVKTWDLVDGKCKEGADAERVCSACNDVRELNVELLPVVVNPAAWERAVVDTIEADDVRGAKECVEDETDHASDTVLGENIHSIINADPVLDYRNVSTISVYQND